MTRTQQLACIRWPSPDSPTWMCMIAEPSACSVLGISPINMGTALWTAARPLFERLSQAKDMAQIDSRLANVEKTRQKILSVQMAIQGTFDIEGEDSDEGADGWEHPVPVLI
ncbi:hypothetical protein K438DRAFT_1782867 [Mycena galopus ATCC 62051]|nr:hypothetical protein K438DRAFT_1782867 [Mycena galopus ATCC 62051]